MKLWNAASDERDTPFLRSDNVLVFLNRRFREACTFYRLS